MDMARERRTAPHEHRCSRLNGALSLGSARAKAVSPLPAQALVAVSFYNAVRRFAGLHQSDFDAAATGLGRTLMLGASWDGYKPLTASP